MGGKAGPMAARLAASYADEYNTAFATVADVRERSEQITRACEAVGREPIPFSVMGPVIVGRNEAELRDRVQRTAAFRGLDAETLLSDPPEGFVVGTLERAAEQLREYERAGAGRMLCQHNPHDDLEFVELLATELAPLVA
jgi:alkanesulfonate monooxygenase SsuD/methylene tetrahydromethanopterin reductase-like flavin-dependent oxidoreductase (luciferase family)